MGTMVCLLISFLPVILRMLLLICSTIMNKLCIWGKQRERLSLMTIASRIACLVSSNSLVLLPQELRLRNFVNAFMLLSAMATMLLAFRLFAGNYTCRLMGKELTCHLRLGRLSPEGARTQHPGDEKTQKCQTCL